MTGSGLLWTRGPADGIVEMAARYQARDSRIELIRPQNRGTGAACNTATAHARGAWAVLLDADDTLKPNCLERYQEFIRGYPSGDIYTCRADMRLPDSRLRTAQDEDAHGSEPRSIVLSDILAGNLLQGGGAVIRLSRLRELGGFSEAAYNEDYGLWLRMLMKGSRHFEYPETLASCRFIPASKTKDYVRTATNSLEIVEGLDRTRLHALGVEAEYEAALRSLRSRVAIARVQETVVAGDYAAARHHLFRRRKSITWSFGNCARAVATLAAPEAYRCWLRREVLRAR